MADKLDIKTELLALDRKERGFYDSLSDEEKKKFSTFLMIRWGSSVQGNEDLQAYYLVSTNQKMNKNYFDIHKNHDKLHWLTATTISPGMGKQYHQWIPAPKRGTTNSKVEKFLANLYPDMKIADIGLVAKMNTLADIKKFAEELGMTKEQIKKDLG